MKNLVKHFQNTSNQHGLWKKGSRIVLGISGGTDSACLLNIFSKIQKTYSLDLIIAHVNYGLRGKSSLEDEMFVRKLAEKHNLEIKVLRAEKTAGNNLENRLREIRYNFFEKIRQENNFDLIAVAHNLDDQAETFLMRVLRGSGLNGLSAMKFKTGLIIRPLLSTPKEEILDYLNSNKLPFRTDKTNLEMDFYRNKIRNQLMPFLEKNYNPNIKKTLFESTLSISDDNAFLEDFTKNAYEKNGTLSAQELTNFHPAIQKRLLLEFIAEKKPDKKDIQASHIREILKIIKSTKNKNKTTSFEGLKIIRKGDTVTISKI